MGLPMWKDPEEVKKTCTKKKDTTAPARSAIRRQRTIRHSGRAQSSMSHLLRDGHEISWERVPTSADGRSHVMTESMPNEDTDWNHARQGNGYPEVAETRHTVAAQLSRVESGRILLRDALSYERPYEQMRTAREMGSTTTSESQADVAASEGHFTEPGIGFRDSGEPSYNSLTQNIATYLGAANFTPGFAPAYRLPNAVNSHRITEGQSLSTRSESLSLLSHRLPALRDALRDDGDCRFVDSLMTEIEQMRLRNPTRLTPNYLTEEASYLRHIGTQLNLLADHSMGNSQQLDISELPSSHRTTSTTNLGTSHSLRVGRRRQQGPLDGLGDRQRSFSPDDDGWDTMLMTIPLDEQVPSARSSFMSTVASNASLTSSSIGSSSATMTSAPSIPNNVDICPAPDNESDDENVDIIEVEPLFTESSSAQTPSSSSEHQLSRIETLSYRLDRQRANDEYHTRYRRLLEREQDLQRLESSLRRLERQVSEDTATLNPAARQRPEERL